MPKTKMSVAMREAMLIEHDKILIRGNGEPSLQEDVRMIKRYLSTLTFWLTTIGVAFIGQAVATLWYIMTNLAPVISHSDKITTVLR